MRYSAVLMTHVTLELERVYSKHGKDKWGRHEFYGVLKEEVDELWNVIKADGTSTELLFEMAHIIAVVLRYYETGNRYCDGL